MTVVENCPLMAGHTFAEKETMMLRIGEEANLCNIRVKVLKSCKMQYKVAGDSFYVKVSNLMFQGWMICSLCCRENNDALIIPTRAMYLSKISLQSPFTGEWLVGAALENFLTQKQKKVLVSRTQEKIKSNKVKIK